MLHFVTFLTYLIRLIELARGSAVVTPNRICLRPRFPPNLKTAQLFAIYRVMTIATSQFAQLQ